MSVVVHADVEQTILTTTVPGFLTATTTSLNPLKAMAMAMGKRDTLVGLQVHVVVNRI
jgi:hypothetical protein